MNRNGRKKMKVEKRNCDNPLAKDLLGAVTLYCHQNPGLPPMVEWNAIRFIEFCKWLFRKDGE